MIDFDAYKQETYRPALDGLRAISIIMVFLNHLGAFKVSWPAEICGWAGVWVFFLLSGYLIYMLLLKEEATAGGADLKAFYIRRVARIVPLYIFVILLYAVLCFSPAGHGKGPVFLHSLPYLLSFNAEYVHDSAVLGQAWTLGIEEKFYLVLPIVGFLALSGRRGVRRVAMMAAIPVCLALNGHRASAYAALFLGALIADGLDGARGYARLSRLASPPWWIYGSVVVSAWLAARYHEALGFVPAVYLGWLTLCSALILIDALLTRGRRFAILKSAPLRKLGRLSYAFYLVHVVAINLCAPIARGGMGRQALGILAAFCVATGLAWMLHHGVERPGIALARRMLARGKGRTPRDPDGVPVPSGPLISPLPGSSTAC